MICAPLPESSFIILEIPNNALDSFLLVMGELINAIRSSVWYLESKEKLGFQVSEPYPNIHMPSPCRSISSSERGTDRTALSPIQTTNFRSSWKDQARGCFREGSAKNT